MAIVCAIGVGMLHAMAREDFLITYGWCERAGRLLALRCIGRIGVSGRPASGYLRAGLLGNPVRIYGVAQTANCDCGDEHED